MATTPLTKRGAEKLKAELHRLKTKIYGNRSSDRYSLFVVLEFVN